MTASNESNASKMASVRNDLDVLKSQICPVETGLSLDMVGADNLAGGGKEICG